MTVEKTNGHNQPTKQAQTKQSKMAGTSFKLSNADIFVITFSLLFLLLWVCTGETIDKRTLRKLVGYRTGRFY